MAKKMTKLTAASHKVTAKSSPPVVAKIASPPSDTLRMPMPDFRSMDALMTAGLSFQMSLWQAWFVTLFGGTRVDGLPLAGASQHDLPITTKRRSPH